MQEGDVLLGCSTTLCATATECATPLLHRPPINNPHTHISRGGAAAFLTSAFSFSVHVLLNKRDQHFPPITKC